MPCPPPATACSSHDSVYLYRDFASRRSRAAFVDAELLGFAACRDAISLAIRCGGFMAQEI
jgi:hypothetical protein